MAEKLNNNNYLITKFKSNELPIKYLYELFSEILYKIEDDVLMENIPKDTIQDKRYILSRIINYLMMERQEICGSYNGLTFVEFWDELQEIKS